MHPFLMPLGFLALGAVFVGLAWWLLHEYQKAFAVDPVSVMSLEVFGQLLRLGGPGYVAMVVLVAGVLLLLAGVALLLMVAWIMAQPLLQSVWGFFYV